MNHRYPFNLILASASPRRKELLEKMGFDFKVEVVDADETPDVQIAVEQQPEWLAQKKADLIPFVGEQSLVIAADTLVIHDRRILGKPQDAMEAREMLMSLSGTSHQVITGVCLRRTHERTVFSESTEVHFSVLSEDEIDYYIQQYKPFDKAGAYGIQEWIGLRFVHKIVGSYTNVVGLPTERLYSELKKITLRPQDSGKG